MDARPLSMLDPSAFPDSFARDRLPPAELWPVFHPPPGGDYPRRMNAATELLDRAVAAGHGARPALGTATEIWTYAELLDRANRIAAVLTDDLGLVPGNRVLLRAANSPMLAACWLAVLKAGGIAVATIPLLRARELSYVVDKAQIRFALCDAALRDELDATGAPLRMLCFNGDAADGLEARAARKSGTFDDVVASHDDVALIAFTSGTTGNAKGTMHFHRDVLSICDAWQPVLRTTPDDVFAGSAPFAFTFGLGALLLFPLRHGASAVLLEQAKPELLLDAMARRRVTTLFTVPTLYRTMTPQVPDHDLGALRTCISSGEHLPASVWEMWRAATGLRIQNSIGSTEMLHAFVAMPAGEATPGPCGRPLPGHAARVVDEAMNDVPPGTVGRLAVRGPTGCRYLDDTDRQRAYVRDGWNLTGDAFTADAEGCFWYHARTDDMIVSAGYNISGAEVEEVLLDHPAVRECAVVGVPDAARGQIVKAFVVLADTAAAGEALTLALQERVRACIAPYKYPRAIAYVAALPRTPTGKIQRNLLRDGAE
ncbi:MAG TPA: AMP-binding protein [Pseudolabrys sp.]|nr:AMP-binding protein [Pseudolabrys sp.]